MAKKIMTPLPKIQAVSCYSCKYMQPGDHPAIMWCDKIKMPRPSATLKNCIHKTLK